MTRRYVLLFLTAAIVVITSTMWQRNSTNFAQAAPPIIEKTKQKHFSARKQAGTAVTDLVVDAMEVTQAVQDLKNSVPLVMGKRTFVRVYAHSTNGTYPTTAQLTVQAGSMFINLLPISPGGPFINVRPTYSRLISNHAFLFEIPKYITYFSPLTLIANVNPTLFWHPNDPLETTYSNNSIAKNITFNEISPLSLVIASQPYIYGNTSYSPSIYDMWSMADWIQRAYPISQLKLYFRTLPAVNVKFKPDGDLAVPDCYMLNSYLAAHRASLLGFSFTPNLAMYGMVSDTVGFMRGCAPLGGYYITANTRLRVGSGPSGDWDHGWDFDGTYADWYGGHELGHAFSQPHVKGGPGYVEDGCGGEAYASKHWPNGRISPTLVYTDPTAAFGFDYRNLYTNKQPVLGPNWHDMMTYCDYQWISSLTYNFLQVMMKSQFSPNQLSIPSQPAVQDVLAVFGAIDQNTGQATLQPTSILYSVPDVVLPPPGDYAIVQYDADGNELERYSFSPHSAEAGQFDQPSRETQYTYINELVPYAHGTVAVHLEGPGGNLLAEINAGLGQPIVEVDPPVRFSAGDTITVTWTASDPDDDPLTFNIDYSPDNGETWEPAGLFYTGRQAVIDKTNLPAGDQARLRVWASDGINTTGSTTDPFIVNNHPPTGEIIQPATEITVAVSQTVSFEGQVYDIDLGTLDGTNIQWSSSMDGYLGPGAIFNTDALSQGIHLITMTADDGQGGVITDQVTVTVVATPNDLPPQPDTLSVGPEPVFLEPAGGLSTATIYVDNLNLGSSIAWSATPDHPWVLLGADSGTTPGDLTVSADLTGLDFGTYTAVVTFRSPDTSETAAVHVVLTIPKYTAFLPLATK